MDEQRRLLPVNGRPVSSLTEYVGAAGLTGLRHVDHSTLEAVVDEISRSGLRGRGGAGFPTGVKWAGVIGGGSGPRYACCNAAEGEPGTFKDRHLLRLNPYQVIEGLAIAARVIGAARAFICLKRSFAPEIARVQAALDELRAAGVLGATSGLDIEVVLGPEEYLFGEEKALLEVIEGNLPLPRVLPPYLEGLFRHPPEANPTLVNNVETLANVPHILRHGADWFRRVGTGTSPGTMIFTLTGDVRRAGCFELPLGTPLRRLVEDCGEGMPAGRTLKVVCPGASSAVITADRLDTPLDFDAFREAGSGLGSGGFIVYDDSACAVAVAQLFSRFLYVESCGQCPPCKLGTGEITHVLERLERGEGSAPDVEALLARCATVDSGNRCALPVGERVLVQSLIRHFEGEFHEHFHAPCPRPRPLLLPKIVDLDPHTGRVAYDERQGLKQPDWRYVE
jgi:NADH:ubiquinone oxidoreductase subunit F (NADH-binding)